MAETTETLKSIENKTIHLEHKKTKNKNFLAPLQRRLFADDSSDNKRDEKFYFDKKSKNKLGEKTKQKNYFDKTKQKRTAKCFPKVVKRVSLGGVSSFNRYRSPSPNKNRGWQTPPANYQPWTPKNVRKSYEDVMVSRETPKLKCISPEKKTKSPKRKFEIKKIFISGKKKFVESVDNYSILDLIGRGSFFNVYKVRCSKTKRLFALKKSQNKITTQHEFDHFSEELIIIKAVGKHPCILSVLAAWMENSDMYHLTPLLNSTLNDWPRCDNLKLGAIPASKLETGIWRVLQDLSSALEHIRSKGFVHVDVKPSNVLVRRGATLVWDRFLLNDFGQARPLDGTKAVKARGLGEWRYRPPEILERTASLRHDGEAVDKIESNYDIYSLGLVVLDILVGTILPLKALEKIREGNIDDFLGETKWSSKLKRLVAEMMSFEALKRPTSAEIVKKCENGILGKFSE